MTSASVSSDALVHASGCPFSSVGSRFNPFEGAQLRNPYSFYAEARRDEPVFYSELLKMWYVTRYDDIVAIARDTKRFSSADAIEAPHDYTPETTRRIGESWIARGSLTNNDPPHHDIVRRIVNKAFTNRHVAGAEAEVRRVVRHFLNELKPTGHTELVESFSFPVALQAILNHVGIPLQNPRQMRVWADDWLSINHGQLDAQQQQTVMDRMLECQQYWLDLIAQRRAEPQEALLDEIIRAANDEETRIHELQLVNVCMTIYVAGHQTTQDLIDLCLYHLLKDSEQTALVLADPENILRAVEETLRFDSPVNALMRTTTEAVRIAGIDLPKGARIALLYASANHDEKYAPEMSRFDLRRTYPKAHLAFGHGTHFCIGAPFARLVARVAIEELFRDCLNLRLKPGQQFEYAVNPVHRGIRRLELEWDA